MLQPVDLHCHSIHSDGKLSPRDLTDLMASKNVRLFSLTDHDSVMGLSEAAEQAKIHGIGFIPGVEFSSNFLGNSLHILGLDIDPLNEELTEFLAATQALRLTRFEKILDRLEYLGFDVREQVSKIPEGTSLGRQHIAEALLEAGLVESKSEAFKKYIGKSGAAYFPCPWPSMDRVIKVIHAAGGVAVMAHPGSYGLALPGLRQLFRMFRDAGGDAAEVASGPCAFGLVQRLAQLCSKYKLLISAGSDFHDPRSTWVKAGEYQKIPANLPNIWEARGWWTPEQV